MMQALSDVDEMVVCAALDSLSRLAERRRLAAPHGTVPLSASATGAA